MPRHPSAFVISLTPFDESSRLDEEALRGHYRRLLATGIGVYVVGGGSGEAYTLDAAETRRVLEIAKEELHGRAPVRVMGAEPRTAKQMIEFGEVVKDVGLDTMQIYSLDIGHGASPRPNELETYFTDVLSHVELRSVLSTHISVGYLIPIEVIERLVKRFDHIIGVNCTSPDVTYLVRLLDALGDRIEVHVGGPMQALTALALGASGFLSSEANLAPRLAMSVITRYAAGDIAGSHEAFARLLRLFTLLTKFNGLQLQAMKACLGMLGLPGGAVRKPRLPGLDEAAMDDLRRGLQDLDIQTLECPEVVK